MASKTQVTLIDDIDGAAAAETIGFSLDGKQYQIDLSARNPQEQPTESFPPPIACVERRQRQDPPAATRSGYARALTPDASLRRAPTTPEEAKTMSSRRLDRPTPLGMTCGYATLI